MIKYKFYIDKLYLIPLKFKIAFILLQFQKHFYLLFNIEKNN